MAGVTLRMDPWLLLPRRTAIAAHGVGDTGPVVPDNMHGTVRRHFHPRAIDVARVGKTRPRPARSGIAAGADRDLGAFVFYSIIRHSGEVERAVRSDREIDIGVADGTVRFASDIHPRPGGAGVVTPPELRHGGFSIASHEQSAVRVLDQHRLARQA